MSTHDLHALERLVKQGYPRAITKIKLPRNKEDGTYWLDIEHDDIHLVIQWRRGRGFGVSRPDREVDYGEKPEAVHVTSDGTFDFVKEMLGEPQPLARKPDTTHFGHGGFKHVVAGLVDNNRDVAGAALIVFSPGVGYTFNCNVPALLIPSVIDGLKDVIAKLEEHERDNGH